MIILEKGRKEKKRKGKRKTKTIAKAKTITITKTRLVFINVTKRQSIYDQKDRVLNLDKLCTIFF